MNLQKIEIQKISQRFNELKELGDQNHSNLNSLANLPTSTARHSSINNKPKTLTSKKELIKEDASPQKVQTKKLNILTHNDIVKELVRLKPYLELDPIMKTSEEIQEEKNKEITQQSYKMMSDLIIVQNRKLCEVLEEAPSKESAQLNRQLGIEKKGWIFQIFYRMSLDTKPVQKQQFLSAFALMTEYVQVFDNLTFTRKISQIRPSQITKVRYLEVLDYSVIRIEKNKKIIEIGFLDEKTFQLFDRMLFLQHNMSKSTSTRLFQNQLLRSMYSD